jgi:hypothetical protein
LEKEEDDVSFDTEDDEDFLAATKHGTMGIQSLLPSSLDARTPHCLSPLPNMLLSGVHSEQKGHHCQS